MRSLTLQHAPFEIHPHPLALGAFWHLGWFHLQAQPPDGCRANFQCWCVCRCFGVAVVRSRHMETPQRLMRPTWWVILLLLWAPHTLIAQLCGQSYDSRIAAIHKAAKQLDGRQPRLLLAGSSSIRKWPQTDTVFSQFDVVNAGFGGSCFSDLWALRDTLIYALRPQVLVVYEGDNDLSDGVPSEDILEVANRLLEELSRRLPETEVVVIAPKASRARHHLASTYLTLNRELRLVAMNHGAHWVDFWGVQHHADGTLRDDLFVADRLHLNDLGYAVWVRELRRQLPWLDPRN